MPSPDGCPEALYITMKDCWHLNPESRPSFKLLKERLFVVKKELRQMGTQLWREPCTAPPTFILSFDNVHNIRPVETRLLSPNEPCLFTDLRNSVQHFLCCVWMFESVLCHTMQVHPQDCFIISWAHEAAQRSACTEQVRNQWHVAHASFIAWYWSAAKLFRMNVNTLWRFYGLWDLAKMLELLSTTPFRVYRESNFSHDVFGEVFVFYTFSLFLSYNWARYRHEWHFNVGLLMI